VTGFTFCGTLPYTYSRPVCSSGVNNCTRLDNRKGHVFRNILWLHCHDDS